MMSAWLILFLKRTKLKVLNDLLLMAINMLFINPWIFMKLSLDGKVLERVYNQDIKNGVVEIPDSVTSIRMRAFKNCPSLTAITIPSGITEIDVDTFSCCPSLTTVIITNGVTKIGEVAFACCPRLTEITIPDSIIEIGPYALNSDSLEKIIIEAAKKGGFARIKKLLPEKLRDKAVDGYPIKKAAKERAKSILACFSVFQIENKTPKVPRPICNAIIEQATGYKPPYGDIPEKMDYSKAPTPVHPCNIL